MTNVNCLVIRRSTNTNSFGLRGFWVICEHSRRVFSFAANDLDAKAYIVGEFVPVPFTGGNGAERPAHELCQSKGKVLKATSVPEFLSLFNDTLADKWTAYRRAKAIEAATA